MSRDEFMDLVVAQFGDDWFTAPQLETQGRDIGRLAGDAFAARLLERRLIPRTRNHYEYRVA